MPPSRRLGCRRCGRPTRSGSRRRRHPAVRCIWIRPSRHVQSPARVCRTERRWCAWGVGWRSCLGIFVGLVVIQRWLGGQRRATLPTDVIQVYGRVPLTARQHLLLVRVGQRLLILLESAQGISRLAEITDPAEVGRLVERFRQPQNGRAATRGGLQHAEDQSHPLVARSCGEKTSLSALATQRSGTAALARELLSQIGVGESYRGA